MNFTKSNAANKSFYDTNIFKQEEAFYSKNKLKENKAPKSSKFQKVSNSKRHNPSDKSL